MSLTIDEFFAKLDAYHGPIPIKDLVPLMTDLELSLDDIPEYVAFCDEHYQRNLWRCGSGYAALILCWSPGQASPVHDHRGSACGVRVLQGQVTETQYRRDEDDKLQPHITNEYPEGMVCGSYDSDTHIISNNDPNDRNLITLHIYTPPLSGYHVYNLEDGTSEVIEDSTLQQQKELLGIA